MGLTNGTAVLKLLRHAAPDAFRAAVDTKVRYSTVAVDLMSVMFSLFHRCRDGHELRSRLREMFRQHRFCSDKSADKKFVSVVALEDYARTPKNKEIERKSRIEKSDETPYTDTVEVWLKTSFVDEDGNAVESAVMPWDKLDFTTVDARLPKDYGRVRATPILTRKLMRYLCRIIAENVEFLVDGDANHLIIVDGFRDYKNLTDNDNEHDRNSDAASKVGMWRSDTGEIFAPSTIGEGEVKATSWAINYNSAGHVLVHVNDGDIIPLLSIYSARVHHENLITGVMSQSYLFPVGDTPVVKKATKDEKTDKKEEKDERKVFDSMRLAIGIYETINQQQQEKGLVMPQTYFLFMFMCGNDYVDSLFKIGPAKLMTAISSRRPGLLDKAVMFAPDADRINVEVDEKVVIETLVYCAGKELEKNGQTPEKIAAWLRRVIWTLDYNINAPLSNELLDPCAQRGGESLHGYKLDANNRCVFENDVWRPTIVRFTLASDRIKRDAHCAFEPTPEALKIIEEHDVVEERVLMQSEKKIKIEQQEQQQQQSIPPPTPKRASSNSFDDIMKSLTPRNNARTASLLTIRQPVPFGVTKE